MKIMHFIHGLSTGGAETLVKEYALKLHNDKFEVVILCFDHHVDSPYEKILHDNNIKVIYINDYLLFKKCNNIIVKIISFFQKYYLVRKFIITEKVDVLHSHLLLNSYVKFACKRRKIKIFHTVHSDPKKLWFNSKKGIKDFKCASYLVKHNNMKIITLHDEMKNEIDNMFKISNSIVLNNGIDFNRFKKNVIKDKIKLKKELNIPINSFVIGHVGRFNVVKNHMFLVDVFYHCFKNNNKFFLLLIGNGDDKNKVVDKLDSYGLKGRYLILSNRSDIPDLLNIMDYFVFPSLYEGLPLTLIEAQKMKLPCFISDSISKTTTISNLITRLSLDNGSKFWANKLLNYNYPDRIELNDSDWDMNKIIKKLEKLYMID